MDFLQRLRNGTTEKLISIHIGSVDRAKGAVPYGASALFRRSFSGLAGPLPRQGGSRDFAAVMAQTGPAATF
jgi:hypothetical protein